MKKDLSIKHICAIYLGLLALIVLTLLINTSFFFQNNFQIIDDQIKKNTSDLYKVSQILENNYSNKLLSYAELKKNHSVFFSTDKQLNIFIFINRFQIEYQNNNDKISITLELKAPASILLPYLIIWVVYTLFFILGSYLFLKNQNLNNQFHKLLTSSFQLSQKLAHDIRSPLSTLNLISSKLADHELKELQLAVVQQINTIAQEHLTNSQIFNLKQSTNKTHAQILNQKEGNSSLKLFFQRIEQEYAFKRISIPQNFEISVNYDALEEKNISKELENLLYRSINNFIQNSVEATPDNGKITLKVESINDRPNYSLTIIVEDSGKGIPNHIIRRLGREQISFGKRTASNDIKSGNGIAILNAANDLKLYGVRLDITSQENIGTRVAMLL